MFHSFLIVLLICAGYCLLALIFAEFSFIIGTCLCSLETGLLGIPINSIMPWLGFALKFSFEILWVIGHWLDKNTKNSNNIGPGWDKVSQVHSHTWYWHNDNLMIKQVLALKGFFSTRVIQLGTKKKNHEFESVQ